MNFRNIIGYMPAIDKFLKFFIIAINVIVLGGLASQFILPAQRIRSGSLQHVVLDKTQYAWVYERVETLAKDAGETTPELFFHPDANPNIFVMYRFSKPFLVFTSGIFKKCSQPEIKALLAHEMTHIKRSMIPKTVGLQVLALGAFFAAHVVRWALVPFGSVASVALGCAIQFIPQLHTVADKCVLSFMRNEEYAADAGAVQITKDPSTFIAAISGLNGDYKYTEEQEPMQAHPLLEKRIARIQAMMAPLQA